MPEAPPVRMVHLGIGNFHRAHQAWYTANAPDAAEWGTAGFTSRRPDMAEQLAPQDGLYTLITRGGTGDDFSLIGSLAAVHPSTDHASHLDYLRRSEVAVVTITVTEVGYLAGSDGSLDRTNDAVQADIAALRDDSEAPVTSIPAVKDPGAEAANAAAADPDLNRAVEGVLRTLDRDLPSDTDLVETVRDRVNLLMESP